MKSESLDIVTELTESKPLMVDQDETSNKNTDSPKTLYKDATSENIIFTRKDTKRFKFPFIIYIVIFTFILFLSSIIALIVIYDKYQIYYQFDKDIYLKPKISEHNYSRLLFNNGLEIVLTQVHYNDTAGGALSFEKGYLDLEYPPGFLQLALLSLRYNDKDNISTLRDYMGDLYQSTEEFYSTIYFTILNNGFDKFLKNFQEYSSYDKDIDNLNQIIDQSLKRFNTYASSFSNVNNREKYLVEFLVYNITDGNKRDINRQGTVEEIEEKLKNNNAIIGVIMDQLFTPTKIKLTFFSHYKMSLMKKYILRNLHKLTVLENNGNNNQETDEKKTKGQYPSLITNKIIYFKISDSDSNYIKINYYVNNDNATLEQLYIDSGYFNYIKYILDETNEDSLYYNLTHSSNENGINNGINIRSMTCNFEVVLKSRIRFTISIYLNYYSYAHIKKIINIVYDYMEKIKSHIINFKTKDERISELIYINDQNFSFTEDLHEGEFYKNKAKDLFYRDNDNYFLKEVWLPPDLDKNETNMDFYINQLTMENSVVIIGLNDYSKNKYNINTTDISLIFNDLKQTKSLNITYSIHELKELNIIINNSIVSQLVYHKNKFISNYSSSYDVPKGESINHEKYELLNENNDLVKFYWIYDTSFKLPKASICFYLFHPFQRPNYPNQTVNDIIFYHLMLYLAHMERETDFALADAKRAGNTFRLGSTHNYLFIDILAYSDVIEDILTIIKERILTVQNETIVNNYLIYKDHALEKILNIERANIKTVLRYEFYKHLSMRKDGLPPIYNRYTFPKKNFEYFTAINKDYIASIKIPIMHSFIMGYYDKEQTWQLYNIFAKDSSDLYFKSTLEKANYDDKIKADEFVQFCVENQNLDHIKRITNYTRIRNNYVYSFMRMVEYSDLNRVPVEMLRIISQDNGKNITLESFLQKDIYLSIIYPFPDYYSTNEVRHWLKEKIHTVNESINKRLDVFGGRYYVLVHNLEIQFNKTANDLVNTAIDLSYNQIYNRKRVIEGADCLDTENYNDFENTIYKYFNDNPNYYEFSNRDNS